MDFLSSSSSSSCFRTWGLSQGVLEQPGRAWSKALPPPLLPAGAGLERGPGTLINEPECGPGGGWGELEAAGCC